VNTAKIVAFDTPQPPPFAGEFPSALDTRARHVVFDAWKSFIGWVVGLGGVSDIMLTSWGRCSARRNGQLENVPMPAALEGPDPFGVFASHLFSSADNSDSASQEAILEVNGQRLRAVEIRCDHGTEGGREVTLRIISQHIPKPAEVCLPEGLVEKFLENESGLMIFAGATGSGKSTSIAAMLQEAARQKALRIISIEDPIEYRFEDTPIGSIFTQRQLGRDCPDYVSALKRALRMNPDVLFVGEIRDATVAEMVIEAASTGHRVLTTMHGGDPVTSLRRLLSMATAAGMPAPTSSLADCFLACIAQKLISFGKEHPRVAIHEILTRTTGVLAKLRQDQISTMRQEMETGRHAGMITFKASLNLRQQEGRIPDGAALPVV
jgi:twitching motility protein PilT